MVYILVVSIIPIRKEEGFALFPFISSPTILFRILEQLRFLDAERKPLTERKLIIQSKSNMDMLLLHYKYAYY